MLKLRPQWYLEVRPMTELRGKAFTYHARGPELDHQYINNNKKENGTAPWLTWCDACLYHSTWEVWAKGQVSRTSLDKNISCQGRSIGIWKYNKEYKDVNENNKTKKHTG